MIAYPSRTFMTRKLEEAEKVQEEWTAMVGKVVSSYGRITDTLVGVKIETTELAGRPLYQVVPQLFNRDPLFDA